MAKTRSIISREKGQALNDLLTALGLTKYEASRILYVSEPTIGKWTRYGVPENRWGEILETLRRHFYDNEKVYLFICQHCGKPQVISTPCCDKVEPGARPDQSFETIELCQEFVGKTLGLGAEQFVHAQLWAPDWHDARRLRELCPCCLRDVLAAHEAGTLEIHKVGDSK